MHSDELCLCLDIDKRSLFSSALATKYLFRDKANVVHHHHNMKDGLLAIFNLIKAKTNLPIYALFQHPSPTGGKVSRDAIANATVHCVDALLGSVIEGIHYVHDFNTKGQICWKGNELQNTCLSKCALSQRKNLIISPARVVCTADSTFVDHPILGNVPRCGWAQFKKGDEIAFSITSK